MVKYCMNLSDEKKETAIKIALESKGNVRKRKIAVPLLMILGIVIIFSSIFLIINSPAILWYIYMVLGIVCLLLDRKSTRLNSSHITRSRMPSSA